MPFRIFDEGGATDKRSMAINGRIKKVFCYKIKKPQIFKFETFQGNGPF
jgi:hypothetical protein